MDSEGNCYDCNGDSCAVSMLEMSCIGVPFREIPKFAVMQS